MRTLAYTPVGEIRTENAIGFIHPDDRKYGVLAAGVQGTGKSSVLLRQFANDVMDRRAAQIVMDPKMELVERCLEVIPPDCGKEVWYLDLGDPLFGITPLRMYGDSDFGTEAAAVAESVVAALLALAPGQIFQSSRRYLYHAVIGALAIAHEHPQLRPAMFEHVHGLLLPKGHGEALRQVAAQRAPGSGSSRPRSSTPRSCRVSCRSPAIRRRRGSTRRATRSTGSSASRRSSGSSSTRTTCRCAT